jgi:hypothetical protein
MSSSERPANLSNATFAGAMLWDVDLSYSICESTDFSRACLDGVSFVDADLTSAVFQQCILFEIDVSRAELTDADFQNVDSDIRILVDGLVMDGFAALGYLAFHGAKVDQIPSIWKWVHSPKFDILDKIARKLLEQGQRQILGLTQKGAAREDPEFARRLLEVFLKEKWVESVRGRKDRAMCTELGRQVLSGVIKREALPKALEDVFHA